MKHQPHQLIGGRHAVYHAIKAGRRSVHELIIQQGVHEQRLATLLAEARAQSIPITKLSKGSFAKQAPLATHQGVLAVVAECPLTPIEELIASEPQSERQRRLLILDGIQDPHNLGALLRTALCFGMQGALWARRRCAPLSATAVKAAAGAVEYLPLCQVTNLSQSLEQLKTAGYWIYGSVAESGVSLWEQTFPDAAALIIGEEAQGMHRLSRQQCDVLLSIPCVGPLGSLNASVAGGVLMSHFCKQNLFQKHST